MSAAVQVTIAADWQPTPENINALPAPLYRYICELETNCDPAGMVSENVILRDINQALQLIIASQDAELREVRAQLEHAKTTLPK